MNYYKYYGFQFIYLLLFVALHNIFIIALLPFSEFAATIDLKFVVY